MQPDTHPIIASPYPLTDAFGRAHTYLRVSITDRCNLRCSYCMPAEGILKKTHAEILRYEEIVRVIQMLAQMGIRKVRITGGEPLVRPNVPLLVRRIADIPGIEELAMTTNGVLLAENAQILKESGLSSLNISLDTLRPDRFERIALRNDFARVRAGIDAAIEARFSALKLNVVVMAGINGDEIADFVEFVKDKPLCVRFIEYMPFRANRWDKGRFLACESMKSLVAENYHLHPVLPGLESGQAAREYRIDGFLGTVGFIASMSDHFCARCNRLRLTADGALKTCLFFRPEISLRDSLRQGASDEGIARLIRYTLRAKRPCHPALDEINAEENQSMLEIGG